MKKLLVILSLCMIAHICSGQTTVYSFKIDSVSGNNQIDFAAFEGKKILIVNTATEDPNKNQFAELEQLYQLYKDSLIIVGIPSNSFNTEPRTNNEIANYCTVFYSIHFPVSAKIAVTGNDADSLFKWLTDKTQNTMMNNILHGAFQKFLINRQGKLVGGFSRSTSPMSQVFRHAIERI